MECQVVAAPTGSGKTGVLELAMLRMLSRCLGEQGQFCHQPGCVKAVYLGPTKALVQVS
jgi:ATP-dependent DNA helicase HFM1/MER3